ncbi:hypothetical protein ACJVC5_05535 [Peredibacter sp. HCB2-198]|uniref:hypothetical protein n=1 Tax=Peredibacter sp. HCB2-198 TaxID=3383025 RepID=UPI0038B604A3
MKKAIISLIIILVLSVVSYKLLGTPRKEVITSSSKKEVFKKIPRTSLKDVRYQIEKTEVKKTSFPKECFSSLADLSAMTIADYNGIAQSKKSFEEFFGPDCSQKIKENPLFEKLLQSSGCKFNKENAGACISLMFMLKANFIAELNEDKKPEEMTSEELAAHFVRMFYSIDKLKSEKFITNLKLIDVLYNKHMNDPEIIEAYVGYLMIGEKITGVHSVGERIDSILAESEGNSFKVDRLFVIKEILGNNLEGARVVLDGLQPKYPQEPDLHYYYAAYHWKNGHRDLALQSLNQAIAFGENCSSCRPGVYQDTRNRMANAKDKDDQLFSVSIGLNFENL